MSELTEIKEILKGLYREYLCTACRYPPEPANGLKTATNTIFSIWKMFRMEPFYTNQDIVFVKANVIVESGQIGVFCLKEKVI